MTLTPRGDGQPAIEVFHSADPDRTVWESAPGASFLAAAQGEQTVRALGRPEGFYDIKDRVLRQSDHQTLDSVIIEDGALVLRGVLSGPGLSAGYRLTLRPASDNQLRFVVTLEGPGAAGLNRILLRCASPEDERVYGLGQQLTFFDQKGHVVPILVQEHGVGRGMPLLTEVINATRNGGGGSAVATEAPAPHYITTRLRSLFLENYEYSEFDLRRPDRIEIKLFAGTLTGRILFGRTPLDLIEEYTAYAGRMRPLPDWVNAGAIVGLQGGTQVVRQKIAALDRADVPLAAVWIQDWCGRRVTADAYRLWWNWQLDPAYYPGWAELVAELARRNIRVMTYINPYFVNDPGHDVLFKQAQKAGYLVKRADGSLFLNRNRGFEAGMVDLSNPRAREWIKSVIKSELISSGSSGWMADFGEALPFDAALFGGADPSAWHNRYAEAWAAVNREAVEETGRKDIVFFSRSGFTRSPASSTLFWLGDQAQSWDEFDGLKTAVTGLLSGGVSGFSLLHSDVGGYNTFLLKLGDETIPALARSKELLMRWEELNAFSCVLRTHEGNNPFVSAQFDHDAETLAHFARMAKVYRALAFYRKALVDEAARTGHPLARHPFLEFPGDPNTYDLKYQFLFGSELMVAPVLDPGMASVVAYLPKGDWVGLWSERVFKLPAGQWVRCPAPLGKPAVFYRSGSKVGEQLVAALRAEGVYD